MTRPTLGSLFDGSGGFPLAGALCGIAPVWASEIEPYPLRVTAARFPGMRQIGDVRRIDGAAIQPVDVVTFGSPCQDMSIAGRREGMQHREHGAEKTTRSGLFYEAVRIITQMRRATDGRFPRFAIWENVPGAFSSNGGEDFRCVLEELSKIAGGGLSIPRPAGGAWKPAGAILGDGFSVAWRVLDAQYWGVPQRRRRIYLVTDFAGGSAGKILFERAGLRGHPATGREAGQGAAADSGSGACRKGKSAEDVTPKVFHTLTAKNCGNVESAQTPNCVCYTQREYGDYAPGVGTLAARVNVGHVSSTIVVNEKENTPSTLDCRNLVENNEISGTLQAKPGGGYSLNFINPVIYETRGGGSGSVAATITGDHENRTSDYSNVVCMATAQTNAEIEKELSPTILRGHEHPIIASERASQGLRYVVRRLTPLECCRLQGFPDWWESGVEGSDSARYKMWGNGIALPCARYVLEGVAEELRREAE